VRRYVLVAVIILVALVLLVTLRWTCTVTRAGSSCGFTIGSPFERP
jgi:hypothetical protein